MFTLTQIVNCGTVGGSHLSGEAQFSDGKRYRFVIHDGKVESMALPANNFRLHRTPFPARAKLIEAAHIPYLEAALKANTERREREDKAEQERRKECRRVAALNKAAPELLAALLKTQARFDALSAEFGHRLSDERSSSDRALVASNLSLIAKIEKESAR